MAMTATTSPADDAAAIAQHIAAFARQASLEATRPSASAIDAIEGVIPAGTRVYLSAVPHRAMDEVIEPATRLRKAGFEPAPHLAARNLGGADELNRLLSRLTIEANVRSVLVIAGDRDQPAGVFASALDVIESGLLQRHGIAEIGVAGYPEGHPRLSTDALDRTLFAKIEAAEQTGLAVHIVTQFGFDARAMLDWLARLRDLGIEHPVRIGMAGPANLSTLLRYAQRCGVRASAQGLTRHGGLMKHLIGSNAPDGIVRALAEACVNGRFGQVTPHFYSFGGLASTARWITAVAAGRIALDRTDGFGVTA